VTEADESRPSTWERALGYAIVVVCVVAVLGVLHPSLLLKNTTTNGGDMGAHVWWPWFMEHHWFGKLRLSGWAPDWYAGFPVGQYYFPLPSVFVAILDIALPYNVAFKLVTASGPVLLPISAYAFARGMRAPWPAPPAFAVAALGMLMQTRTDWQIYGGNIASTLAGEFSFTLGLAFGLFALCALAYPLDTGRRRWLPPVLIAAAVMCHIVVAIFIGVAAILLWLVRRPLRTLPLAAAIGAVAFALPAVWLIPLVGQQSYTQSMRYTKLVPRGSFKLPSWLPLPGPIEHTIEGIVRGVGVAYDASGKRTSPSLWLPWWIWLLAGVAIVAAGWYRRRSTLVLVVLALVFGVMFVEWPEHAIWNTRFLPFWLLTWGFVAAMGATELCRLGAAGVRWANNWIRDGDLQDARAQAWADVARGADGEATPEQRERAVEVLASRRFDEPPPGWEPPARLSSEALAKRGRVVGAIALSVILLGGSAFAIKRAWDARNGNSGIAISGWATWNYEGYEAKPAWNEYHSIMTTMATLPPGRALWEPSSMPGDPINNYGTSLALELLPYFTNGRIDSMEGLYFESSGTTSYHFLTVSECAEHPSNPVRGLVYGTLQDDFDLCVRHLRMLGVRYLMLWTPAAQSKAAHTRGLKLVRTIPDLDGRDPKGWKVYEVGNSPLVVGMSEEPVVAATHGGTYSQCWGSKWPDTTSSEPRLEAWECANGPWWNNRLELSKLFAASGPKDWKHIDISQLASTTPRRISPTRVSRVHEGVDKISFRVSEIGKPVLVKTSYFPNWQAHGAKGPYRVSPNLMVVVPTQKDVSLTYGLTGVDWLGRFVTLLGIAGVVLLILWKSAKRYAADAPSGEAPADDSGGDGGDGGGPGDDGVTPPDRSQPAPALP
jgi:6-pyruvoyl-tetrahydropterin synthase related domain